MATSLLHRIGSPMPVIQGSSATGAASTLADADGEGVAMVYRFDPAGTSDTITHVGFRQGTTTGTPAANSYEVMIQGVGADGLNDGTDLGGVSPTLTTFTPLSANANTLQWIALGNALAVNRDVAICPMVRANANITASNNIQIQHTWTTVGRQTLPYVLTNTAAAFAKVANMVPSLAVKSATAVYGYPILTVAGVADYGSTTEAGFWFNIPTNFCSTFKVVGVEFMADDPPTGTSTHIITLYSNPLSGTVTIQQQSAAWDVDQTAVVNNTIHLLRATFDTSYTLPALNAGEDYVLGFATTTASAGGLYYLETGAAGDMDAFDGGQKFALTSRTLTSYPPDTDTASFVAVTATRRPWVSLILSDLTAPAGSGGGGMIVHPGMTGGFRG
jgi:hypothetical protein